MQPIPRDNPHASAVAAFLANAVRVPVFSGRRRIGWRYQPHVTVETVLNFL